MKQQWQQNPKHWKASSAGCASAVSGLSRKHWGALESLQARKEGTLEGLRAEAGVSLSAGSKVGADHRNWLCVREVRRGRRGCVGHSAPCRGRCGERALSQRAERCPMFTLSRSRGPAWFLLFVWQILGWPFSELSLCFNCFAIILFPSSVVPFSSQVNLSACPSEGHNF